MNLEQWINSTPVVRHPSEFDIISVMKLHELIDLCKKYQIIILEGVRSCGKSFISDKLQNALNIATYATWKSQGGLKKFYNNRKGAPDGAIRISPTLEVNQANVFVVEYLIQSNTPAIIDRGFFSSMHFQDVVPQDVWDIYVDMLHQIRSVVLFIEPIPIIHNDVILKRGISREAIDNEKRRYLEIFRRLPKSIDFHHIQLEYVMEFLS